MFVSELIFYLFVLTNKFKHTLYVILLKKKPNYVFYYRNFNKHKMFFIQYKDVNILFFF